MTYLQAKETPRFLGAEGDLAANIALVGEAWGEKEARTQRPFQGAAGDELNRLLHGAGITRGELYITNVIKARPHNNDISLFIDLSKKIPRITSEAEEHIEILRQELSESKANVVIATGAVPLFILTGKQGIHKWRGSILESTLVPGKKVIPTIHPAAILPPRGMYTWRYIIINDMKRAKEESLFPDLRLPVMILRTAPTFTDASLFLKQWRSYPIVDVDIEVLREEVSCIALSFDGIEAMCIPFVDEHGDYWNPDQEADIWKLLTEILESPAITKRGHNFMFDASFLNYRHGIRTVNIVDTMIVQAIIFPDFRKGLDFTTSIYTRIPYYKDEGKKWSRLTHSWTQHWEYNAKDVIATANIWGPAIQIAEHQKNIDTVNRKFSIIEPLLCMQARGVRVDISGRELAAQAVLREMEELRNVFYTKTGKEINIQSEKQIKEYFYGDLGLKPYINKKTHKPRTDDDALMRIARQGYSEAQILRDYTALHTLHSRYLTAKLDPDGRLRCAYNAVGAATGRLSSSKTIFDTGMNLQNQPDSARKFLLFDEGYAGYNIDLGQAENRIVAYVGPVPEMIEAFESGKDVHSLTASGLSGLPPDEIRRQDKEGIKCPTIGGGTKTWRYWGKKANHGLNYDEGPNTFADTNDIPLKDAKAIIEAYHMMYPGVRQGFHTTVRNMLAKNRTVVNLLGRRRLFLDRWGDQLFKDAYAHIPQSTVADVIDERGLAFIYKDPILRPVELLLQVHDSIVFQIPICLGWDFHATALMRIISSLETPLEWNSRKFVIPCDVQVSFGNMAKDKNDRKALKEISRPVLKDHSLLVRELIAKHATAFSS